MILCSGEALIDMIPSADGGQFAPHVGGAIFNTAIALGRLGAQVSMFTGLSNDFFGAQLDQALQDSHVDTRWIIRADRPCTLAFAHLKDGHATYSFYDENTAGRMLGTDDLPTLTDEVSALYVGGISLASEPCADTYASLVAAEAAKRIVMCDPNIRPSFIKDEARYRARLEQILAQSDIVKISDEDLDWLYPEDESGAAKVGKLIALGPTIVIMTRGSEGATAWHRDGRSVQVPSQPAKVIDTVGAGDTFNAGVLASLAEHDLLHKESLARITEAQLTHALSLGAQVAAITVSRAGANPPWRAELG